MKRSKNLLTTALLTLLLLICGTNNIKAQGSYTASYQDFYDGLAPYGQWIQDPQYGYVWLPDVDADFRPYYTNGYWANTEYGNTWVSDYDWGWAPFHYGRWTYDNYYGWLWIPDTEWAPAWVSWRSSNDYYGWAPMGPGVNINVNLGLIPVDWWMFVTPTYFYDRSFYRYCNYDYRFRRGVYARTNIINYTYIDNRTTYYTGPRSDDYYRSTGRRPSMFNIDNNRRRGATRVSGNRINMYRPSMRNTANTAPVRVVQADRAVTRRPQVFSGTSESAKGREIILRQNNLNNNRTPGRVNGTAPRSNDVQQGAMNQRTNPQEQRNMQVQQRNTQSMQQGAVPIQQGGTPLQQQREVQVQQRAQQAQQREVQMQQQRDARIQQQRDVQVQQREVQMQQQRDARIQQQRDVQVQQREVQMQQQRDAQVQQQRAQQAQQAQQREVQMQQQRDAQVQQQRAQQAQQREVQMQQQRDVQIQQQRLQQTQQREVQMQQQRDVQIQQQTQQRETQRSRTENNSQPAQQQSPMRMSRDGER
jgi:hypothetical protein